LPLESLDAVCAQLREEIIQICGEVGGHLGASLGAVDLIVALHRVFKSPRDLLVFDVGHQAYAHKLLTGRRARMGTLRQEGGVAPFIDPSESPHDAFVAGHACTAVSAALGMLEARRLRHEPGRVIAVIGDGALTGGLTFEGLNNAAAGLVVVLNDNQMSISINVGAVPRLLRGPAARGFFEALGFSYLGPVDGHALPELIAALEEARRARLPVLVHVVTQKGKGFPAAEEDARTRGHAMGPYALRAGKPVRSKNGRQTFSEAFAQVLEARMETDPKLVVVTPAMLEGSALVTLKERFPERVFDVGIAEQHAVTFSAGLAAQGLKPVCAIYSTFLQRAYDQVIHDVCLPRLPVVFAIDRAGLVGGDGATHQGTYDLAHLRPLPGMGIAAPVFGEDLGPMLEAALASGGPFAIRFPRGAVPDLVASVRASSTAEPSVSGPLNAGTLNSGTLNSGSSNSGSSNSGSPDSGSLPSRSLDSGLLTLGTLTCGSGLPTATASLGRRGQETAPTGRVDLRARWLKEVPDPALTLVTLGPLGLAALAAAKEEPRWSVLDACALQPLDEEAILSAARCGRLVTVEEGTTHGGLGSAVLELLARQGRSCRVRTVGLPDRFVRHGDARAQRASLGLDAAGIHAAACELLT
jgi:1-deoxy-D-xylulose-5-phosphate synthase